MQNPFNFGKPVSPQKFVGRREQIEDVVTDLINPGGHSHAIIGGRRFGKTSFLVALQDMLIKQLEHTEPEEWYVFPVLINLKGLGKRSPEGVFSLMLRTLYDYLHSPLYKRELGIVLDIDVTQTQLSSFAQNDEQECTFDRFSRILEDLLEVFNKDYGLLSFVFLIDETEEIVDQDWTEVLFGHLRSLIYVGALSHYIRCVLTGSSKIIEVREKGSPLLNVLKVIYLEALSNEDILEIIHWANNVHPDVANAVLQQCGGNPFLAQYVMHFVWDSILKDIEVSVPAIVGRFLRERRSDLEQWQSDIGEAGLIAYKVLTEADVWLTEAQVKQQVTNPQLKPKIGSALVSLCYHGLVIHDGTWSKYRIAGELFKNWFVDDILLSLDTPSPPNNPSTTFLDCEPTPHIHLNTRIFPTAYCHSMTADRFPFVTCVIDNTCQYCMNAKVSVEVTIQGFSESCIDTLDVPSGQSEQTILLPKLSKSAVMTLMKYIQHSAEFLSGDTRRMALKIFMQRVMISNCMHLIPPFSLF